MAVKFIIKDKVPEHAWMEDDVVGRLPTEVVLLSFIQHDNVVKCLDLFEDLLYFYLVSRQIFKSIALPHSCLRFKNCMVLLGTDTTG